MQHTLYQRCCIVVVLRTAYTEVGVLLDVLNIAKEKKYMVLTHVQQDTSEPKSAVQLLAKKKVNIGSMLID
ncbi:hypothetical protein DPMN_087889 [Dreissena polymorpha]|uniref:Uncharacterized protein n=1 Tax=Dreissena polymorpha TaxID=45954 RepID=A0A9D4KUV5_DREPO|nr:hypothetical protein DPMN_087889 [Dreissena polymorpha]